MHRLFRILIPAAFAAFSPGITAVAQTVPIPTANPCYLDPDRRQDDKSLSGRLDDCNGVLAPPKVGDSEIVEPALDGGTMRVIPLSALPEQQSGDSAAQTIPATNQNPEGDYDIAGIVESIANAGRDAEVLLSLKPSRIDVRDISIMLRGSNLAVLNASLSEHSSEIDILRTSVTQNPTLAAAVAEKGLKVVGIVGARIGEDRSVTLFGR